MGRHTKREPLEMSEFELYIEDPDAVGYSVLFANGDGESVYHNYPLTEEGLEKAWEMARFAYNHPDASCVTITRFHRDNAISAF